MARLWGDVQSDAMEDRFDGAKWWQYCNAIIDLRKIRINTLILIASLFCAIYVLCYFYSLREIKNI